MRKQILLCILVGLAAVLLCSCRAKSLPEGAAIESLYYETQGMMAGVETSLSIIREGEGFSIVCLEGWGEPLRKAEGNAQMGRSIADILRENNVLSWDGFSGHDPRALDGERFILTISFDDGTTVNARGTNSIPKGMGLALRDIEKLLDQLLWEPEPYGISCNFAIAEEAAAEYFDMLCAFC